MVDAVTEPRITDPGESLQRKMLLDTVKNPAGATPNEPSGDEAEQLLRNKFGYTDEHMRKIKGRDEVAGKTETPGVIPQGGDAAATRQPAKKKPASPMENNTGKHLLHLLGLEKSALDCFAALNDLERAAYVVAFPETRFAESARVGSTYEWFHKKNLRGQHSYLMRHPGSKMHQGGGIDKMHKSATILGNKHQKRADYHKRAMQKHLELGNKPMVAKHRNAMKAHTQAAKSYHGGAAAMKANQHNRAHNHLVSAIKNARTANTLGHHADGAKWKPVTRW